MKISNIKLTTPSQQVSGITIIRYAHNQVSGNDYFIPKLILLKTQSMMYFTLKTI